MDDLYAQFCTEANHRLAELGWTQVQLARQLGLSQRNVAAILSGKHRPTLAMVERITEALDCSAILKLASGEMKFVLIECKRGGYALRVPIFVEGKDDERFFNGIRERMEFLGVSQNDLAKRLGISKQRVSQALSGRNPLDLETMAKYADAVGCTLVCCFR